MGTVEGLNVIVKMGVKPFYVFGGYFDEEPVKKINRIARAAKVFKDLKRVKLGILPYRNFQMITTYVDEFRLYSQIGPVVEYISCLQLKKASDSIAEKEVNDYIAEINKKFKIDSRVSQDNLRRSARVSLGFEKIIIDNKLDGIALSDLIPELHEVVG